MKELKNRDIPYKIYLSEDEMPRYWYNVRADMKTKPAPLLNPGTLKPMTAEEMGQVFCAELVKQEMDDDTATILMVDSNIQRENILPSERAQAYKMKLEAIVIR